jgi:hypothetical protein
MAELRRQGFSGPRAGPGRAGHRVPGRCEFAPGRLTQRHAVVWAAWAVLTFALIIARQPVLAFLVPYGMGLYFAWREERQLWWLDAPVATLTALPPKRMDRLVAAVRDADGMRRCRLLAALDRMLAGFVQAAEAGEAAGRGPDLTRYLSAPLALEHPDITMRFLGAAADMADMRALEPSRRLAACCSAGVPPGGEATPLGDLAAEAHECVERLEAIREARGTTSLLVRPAEAPAEPEVALLRPASGTPEAAPARLLRPSKGAVAQADRAARGQHG